MFSLDHFLESEGWVPKRQSSIQLISRLDAKQVRNAPVPYYLMSQWRQGFAYRTGLSLWAFVIAGSLSLLLAMLTVAYQSLKAAAADPIESLKASF